MLCGLLAPSAGQLHVAGADVREAPASARERLGYVAQKFSLYGPLTVLENLEFFASAYGLRGATQARAHRLGHRSSSISAITLRAPSAQLPGGYKQRLAMAAALLHEPEILFLDEPTSGADPLARRAFWRRITALAEQGVTVIVTTHFMQEAEYCDRVAIMDAGRVLAQGSPAEVRAARQERRTAASRAWRMPSSPWSNSRARARPQRRRRSRHEGAASMSLITRARLRTAGARSCAASARWCGRRRTRSCAIPRASRSAWCCR